MQRLAFFTCGAFDGAAHTAQRSPGLHRPQRRRRAQALGRVLRGQVGRSGLFGGGGRRATTPTAGRTGPAAVAPTAANAFAQVGQARAGFGR